MYRVPHKEVAEKANYYTNKYLLEGREAMVQTMHSHIVHSKKKQVGP